MEYQDFPINLDEVPSKPMTSMATSFGTQRRFVPERMQYTTHATKLSLLDWENAKASTPNGVTFDMYSMRKNNFLTKE